MDGDFIFPIIIVGILFIGFPWVIFHYITKWKTAATLTTADEDLLDELHDLARRLDDRMCTVERIVQADNPNWRQVACDPAEMIEDRRLAEYGARERAGEPAARTNMSRRRNQ